MSVPDIASWSRLTSPRRRLVPPVDDVDEVAVERACRGDRTVRLNRAEMAAAFLWLDSHGYSLEGMAPILGVTSRTILRWRTARHFPLPRPSGTSRNGRSGGYSGGTTKDGPGRGMAVPAGPYPRSTGGPSMSTPRPADSPRRAT